MAVAFDQDLDLVLMTIGKDPPEGHEGLTISVHKTIGGLVRDDGRDLRG